MPVVQFYSLLNLENTGPKLWVCEIWYSYIQWCNKSCMHKKNNNTKINIIQIQYIKALLSFYRCDMLLTILYLV